MLSLLEKTAGAFEPSLSPFCCALGDVAFEDVF